MKDTDLRNRFNGLPKNRPEVLRLFTYGMVADALTEIDDLRAELDAAKARVAVLEAECGVSREIIDANGFPYHNYDPSLGPRLKSARAATGEIGGST
jgi:hypothetical protein